MIDTHTHLYVEEYDADRAEMFSRATDAGVTHFFLPNVDVDSIERLLRTCMEYKHCYPLMGLHPTSVGNDWKQQLEKMKPYFCGEQKMWGVGEVGLDLYWDKTFLKEQCLAFDVQIQWALEYDLPLIIHVRDAFPELFQVLSPYKNTPLKGIFHSFTGMKEDAVEALAYEGFMLGINGVVTFKNSNLSCVLESVPIERVVLETDAPYLTPVPYRGKRNESAYLPFIAQKIADVYHLSYDEIIAKTTQNALKVFYK